MVAEFHYEFESDEDFMAFLCECEPDLPENWWELEYGEKMCAMYRAYLRGVTAGCKRAVSELETQTNRRKL